MIVFQTMSSFIIIAFLILAVRLVLDFRHLRESGGENNAPQYGPISPQSVRGMLKTGNIREYTMIDVRSDREFARGHIEQAVNLPIKDLRFSSQLKKLDRDHTYILCGERHSSAQKALEIMRLYGFRKVFFLTGGILEWKMNDYPTVRESS